jgi:hypothetical protein
MGRKNKGNNSNEDPQDEGGATEQVPQPTPVEEVKKEEEKNGAPTKVEGKCNFMSDE